MKKTILMLGTFDSKGKEFDYLYRELERRGADIIAMDVGIFEPVGSFPVRIAAQEVALAGGVPLEELRKKGDRGWAMKIMCLGARKIAVGLEAEHSIQGVIGMGGGGGTSIAATAMQGLPLGVPKVCITTLASGDTREYVGTKDIVLFPSIVDICGLNRFSRMIISRAAGAVWGMMQYDFIPDGNDKPIICVSMFGNTTACVEKCAARLEEAGYAPIIFHATGSGGRSMEELIMGGHCAACLDITTTEWADEICHGILSAGPQRLDGPAAAGIPHVIAPGCLDMVNFGCRDTVPETYIKAKRIFYEWNPMVTLMRTDKKENAALGKILAEKANKSDSPVAFILPLKGVSILDGEGEAFCDWEADRVLFDAIQRSVHKDIPVVKVDANINDDLFAEQAVKLLLKIMDHNKTD